MKTELTMDFSIDKEKNQIRIKREFAAPVAKIWAAWTQSAILDQWWAPKPWKAETKEMNFTEGGRWLYAMSGPNGKKQWSFADYKKIAPQQSFVVHDAFSDENGKVDTSMPRSTWDVGFSEADGSTFVDIAMTFETTSDLQKILDTGFKEGISMCFENLDEFLEK